MLILSHTITKKKSYHQIIGLFPFGSLLSESESAPKGNVVVESFGEDLREYKLHRAVTQIIADLMGHLTALEGLTNFAQSVDLSPKRQSEFFKAREALLATKSRYTTFANILDPKNMEGRTRAEVEDIIVRTMSLRSKEFQNGDERRQALRSSYTKFWDIVKKLRLMGVSDDPVAAGAWYGIYEAFAEGFKAAYTVLRLSMDEVCDVLGRKYFPIYDAEHYKPHFMDNDFEIVKGDQNAPMDEKLILRFCVFAAYSKIELDEKLESGLTLAETFEGAAKVLYFGWMMENYYPEFRSLWIQAHREFGESLMQARTKLRANFFSDVYTYKRLRIILSEMLRGYNCAFQVVSNDDWMSGELSGDVELEPLLDISRFIPGAERASITSIYGPPGTHKSTILGNLVALTTLRKKLFTFMPLSDNSNWPTYAFMPQMPIPGNAAYRFVKKRMKVKPQGIPTLVLNIVTDLSVFEERGEVLTKYDRILKVSNPWSFRFDFESVLDELAKIAQEEFGYSSPSGLIAVRNMERAGTSGTTTKRFNVEIQNATNALDSFNDWRRNHTKLPCRVSFDEVKEIQMEQAKSREQSQLGDLIETAANSARRHHFAMDFVGHLPKDVSPRVRGFSNNTFWRNLPEERSEAKSPLSLLLDSLPLEPSEADLQREAVRLLSNNEAFANSGLFWDHDRTKKRIIPVYPMIAPFQNQVVGKDPLEIYNFYLRAHPEIDKEKFFRRKADLKYDWVGYSADAGSKEKEEEESAESIVEEEEGLL
jgi:hypothetical protein